MKRIGRWLNGLRSATRLIICLSIALGVLTLVLIARIEVLTSIVLAWDAFCATLIAFSWIMFFSVPHDALCRQAQRQDESRSITFILILGAVCISIVGILILLRPTGDTLIRKELHRAVSLLGVALSWLLLHTLFTLRYAHLYYTDPEAGPDAQIGGLDFPKEEHPDYLDFAYFSFTVGMTFQVSDVEVSDAHIRRIVLLHGVLSFVFNTIVVALTISILSNLSK